MGRLVIWFWIAFALALIFTLAIIYHAQGAFNNPAPAGLFVQTMTPPPSASANGYTTWLNQGSATESDNTLGMSFVLPSQGAHAVHGLIKAFSPPYTVTVLLIWGGISTLNNDTNALLGWYDGSNKIDALALNPYNGELSYSRNTYSNFSTLANATTLQQIMPPTPMLWAQLVNDGKTISVLASLDGQTYQSLWSFAIGSGYLSAYSNLIIGGDANLAQAAFTIASYFQGYCPLPSKMVFTTACNSAMQSVI